jgi:formylglycine-generating enzyme required for sulfatase activity
MTGSFGHNLGLGMVVDDQSNESLLEIPTGEFQMGVAAPDRFANDTERPAHRVSIAHRFALGRFPVTVAEFRRFSPGHAPGDDPHLPVVNVSWHEAVAYCEWLSHPSGLHFRLPTEAEWEYACRAGSTSVFTMGNTLVLSDANYLFNEHGERIGVGCRTPAGTYPPNAFGIQDMHGNVCEWVADEWHPSYQGAPEDGAAWIQQSTAELASQEMKATRRVIRGGAWDYLPRLLRSSWRDWLQADARRDNVGFRIIQIL